jgi:hypothetical protein
MKNLKLFDKVVHEDKSRKVCERFGSSKNRIDRQTLDIGQGYIVKVQMRTFKGTSNCNV